MATRVLGPGDEELARQTCRMFGLGDQADPSSFLTRPECSLMIGDDGAGGIAGWVYGHELVHPDGERTMLLYALDVAEHARKRGIGTSLVRAFVDHARERGCTEVWVLTDDANASALATYQAAGGVGPSPQLMFNWKLAVGHHS